MGDVVWIAPASIGAIVRYDPGYPNKELLVRFDRSGSTTSNAIVIWSDVSARLGSRTFGPTRRKLYMNETKSNVATLWYSEWDQAWTSITNVARGYGSSPNWRQAIPLPAQVVLVSPANNATNVSTSPTPGWQASAGALWYRLRVFTQAGSLVLDDPNVVGTSRAIGPLAKTAQYTWTVSGVSNISEGSLSTSFKFTTAAVGSEVSDRAADVPTVYALAQNFPNPFNPTTVISFQLPVVSDVHLAVYDMLGHEVSVLVDERREAGYHDRQFDASGLPAGMYFYRLQARPDNGRSDGQAKDSVASRKLLIVR
jgi:hypothetical protein